MRILTVLGSLQERSKNRNLLELLEAEWSLDHVVVRSLSLDSLPFFNPDLGQSLHPPTVNEWRTAVANAQLIVFASPEYGHSLPGVLKNAIDWLIPSGEFYAKPVIISASVGHSGRGLLGLAALEQTLLAVDADVLMCEPCVNGDVSQLLSQARTWAETHH